MSEPDQCPQILLAFLIFLSYRRGGGFVVVDLEVADASNRHRQRIQYRPDRDSSIEANLKKCSALLEEHGSTATPESHWAHAALCICLAADLPITVTSYGAIAAKSDKTVQFSSPVDGPETDIKVLECIYQQLISQDLRSLLSCIELVNLKDDNSFHRPLDLPIPRPEHDDYLSLFRKAAQQHSEDIAVEAWDKSLTYSQLDSASTAVADSLRSLGVQRGDTVPTAMDWSSWAPVCVLGIFKVGAAFCFVDPQETSEKMDWYVQQVKGRLIMCDSMHQQRLSACLAQAVSVQSFLLDTITPPLESHDQEARGPDLAYVLFTSGSTSTPKTVLTGQQALSAGAVPQGMALGMSECSRVLGVGPLSFAAALPKLLFTLALGACLCIPQPSQGIIEAANQYRTDNLLITVSTAHDLDPTQFTLRQTLCVGAEVVPEKMAALWGRHHDLRLAWGASEMNGVICGCPWESATSSRDVGRVPAHRFWVVDPDDYDRLVPLSWPGEVLVESVALASGYLGNEAATAKAFPRTPAWYAAAVEAQRSTNSESRDECMAPTRWYKTGDIGYLDPAMLSLTVLGRIDALQLQLPGGRVDVTLLEEIAQGVAGMSKDIAIQLGVPRREYSPVLVAFMADSAAPPQVCVAGSGVLEDAALLRKLRDAWTRGGSVGPGYVVVVQGLPRLRNSKIWRHLLREWIEPRTLEQLSPWRIQADAL